RRHDVDRDVGGPLRARPGARLQLRATATTTDRRRRRRLNRRASDTRRCGNRERHGASSGVRCGLYRIEARCRGGSLRELTERADRVLHRGRLKELIEQPDERVLAALRALGGELDHRACEVDDRRQARLDRHARILRGLLDSGPGLRALHTQRLLVELHAAIELLGSPLGALTLEVAQRHLVRAHGVLALLQREGERVVATRRETESSTDLLECGEVCGCDFALISYGALLL